MKIRSLKHSRDGTVIARGIKPALIVAAAEMETEDHSRMFPDDAIVHLGGKIEQAVRVIATLAVSLTQLGIEQRSILWRFDLDITTPEPNQFINFISQNVDQVGKIGIDAWISAG